jgi:ABC-type multidrug transport system fused ATPase/permease subunit
LEGGRIVHAGTHEQLLQQPGYYRDSALLQMEQNPQTAAA